MKHKPVFFETQACLQMTPQYSLKESFMKQSSLKESMLKYQRLQPQEMPSKELNYRPRG